MTALDLIKVGRCCCGEDHLLSRAKWAEFQRVTAGLPATVPLTVLGGEAAWAVPRVYIACHGINAGEVAALAEKYGWERAKGNEDG